VELERVLTKHNLEVSENGASANRVGAISTFPKLVQDFGGDVLDQALSVIEVGWGRNGDSWEGNLVSGVCEVLGRYGDVITPSELIKKIKSDRRSSTAVVQAINETAGSKTGSSGSGSRRVAGFYVVLDILNKRRTKSKIGPIRYLASREYLPEDDAA